MPENKSRRLLQRPAASNIGCNLSMVRTSESRVTVRRRSASMRVGTQRRKFHRIATDDRRLLNLSGPTSGSALVVLIARNKA
jgi:hypothetical protein